MKTKFYQNRHYLFAVACKAKVILLLLVTAALHTQATAQNFHLVKDINASTDASPSNASYTFSNISYNYTNTYAQLNGISYFSADDGVNGVGLWRSDGTTAGTWQVKEGVAPYSIFAANGKLYFAGKGPAGLWTSDGTAAGTKRVLAFLPLGFTNFYPAGFTSASGTVFFSVTGHGQNDQLWKTDGTAAGTVLVKDFYNPSYYDMGYSLSEFSVVNSKMYFSVVSYNQNVSQLSKLWVTDGTATGTYLVSDNVYDPGQIFSYAANGGDTLVYFSATSTPGASYRSLFVTTGVAGQVGVANGFDGNISYDYNRQKLINRSGVLYFIGRPTNNYTQNQNLYKFDLNTGNGVQLVKMATGTTPTGGASYIYTLDEANGSLFFTIWDAPSARYQFWKSDGTSVGSILLKDSLYGYNMIAGNGAAYFLGYRSRGYELWKSDGTPNGTGLVKEINPAHHYSGIGGLTYSNGKLLFSAQDGVHGSELWQSDGTIAGTTLLKDINQTTTASSSPNNLFAINNKLVFNAYNGFKGSNDLLASDGSSAGTYVLTDSVSYMSSTAALNNQLYFSANTLSGRSGIYKTDGTVAGTVAVKEFGLNGFSFYSMAAAGSLVYFNGYNFTSASYELWRTDGTAANTFLINNFSSYINYSLKGAGDNLYFSQGTTLWTSDGTVAGTVPLTTFGGLDYLKSIAFNNKLFFPASNGSGYTLWQTDGTVSGTVEVSPYVTNLSSLVVSNGSLYFNATGNAGVYGNVGTELFKSDGTLNGTVLVKDIHPGIGSTTILQPVSTVGKLFFFTNSATSGRSDLWVTDGSDAGTKLLREAVTPDYFYQNTLTTSNGKLFFVTGGKLWQSDGTVNGTDTVTDNIFNSITLNDYYAIVGVEDKLFFPAYSYAYGQELYEGTTTTLPVKLLSFTGTLDKQDGLLKWSTANEQNNSYFNLQRSTDGVEFRNIAKIKGAGNTSVKTDYRYTDPNIVQLGKDKIYYRLQQVDQDGTASLSKVVLIDINKKQPQYFVAPNPAKNTINLYASSSVEHAQISLIDMNGRVVSAGSKNLSATQPLQIESAALATGLYVLKIETQAGITQIKVVKE